MIKRAIEDEARVRLKEYPVLVIMGGRQTGKTTLAEKLFSKKPSYNFEDPLLRNRFKADPVAFFDSCPDGAVLDEIQNIPELPSYLQPIVDRNKRPGQFIITGSQQLLLLESITQSLAGRAGFLELHPFSREELNRISPNPMSFYDRIFSGAYPPVYDRNVRPSRWYADYIKTYIERDIREISQIQHIDPFLRFMGLASGASGQLINTLQWGSQCGVDNKTIAHWISVLERSFIAQRLKPYHVNIRKRLIKTPRLYFYDTGLVCRLLELEKSSHLNNHPLLGALMETLIFSELIKMKANGGHHWPLYFWRTQAGQEIDFIIDRGSHLVAIEVKAGKTVHPDAARKLSTYSRDFGATVKNIILYAGRESYSMHNCAVLPWHELKESVLDGGNGS